MGRRLSKRNGDGTHMKLSQHQLKMYMDDDYRENVLKSRNSKDVIKELMEIKDEI